VAWVDPILAVGFTVVSGIPLALLAVGAALIGALGMAWMKIDAACAYAGAVSRKTIYSAVRRGELRAARIGAGRNLLFASEWIDAYLRERAQVRDAHTGEVIHRPKSATTSSGAAA
jgi:excisionase family DNA binding protein